MASKKVIEINEPDGYEFAGKIRKPLPGDFFEYDGKVQYATDNNWAGTYPILRPIPPREKTQGWVNVYATGLPVVYPSKGEALDNAARFGLTDSRNAAIPITY